MRVPRTLSTTTTVVVLAFLALFSTGTHTVSPGETLASIAARLTMLAAGPAMAAPTASTGSYRVQRGDTLGSIAARAGTTISQLVSINSVRNPNLIRIGQLLALPSPTAPTAAPAPVPAPGVGTSGGTVVTPAGGAISHVVRSGDTIGGIAAHYSISAAQLVAANGITNGIVYLGQRLNLVPTNDAAPTATTTGTTHTVAPGQTLSSIAQRYGTTLRAIQDANGIADPNVLHVGQTLKIPSTSGGSTGLVCPIQGPMHHMNDWGFPRSGGRFHQGNDLFAARGTPGAAVVAGSVVQTVGSMGGNQVKLLGDDGVTYYYTHLDRFGASGRVSAGAVIGYVGSSGDAAGGPTHVHFEVHPGGGAAVNPFSRVSVAC